MTHSEKINTRSVSAFFARVLRENPGEWIKVSPEGLNGTGGGLRVRLARHLRGVHVSAQVAPDADVWAKYDGEALRCGHCGDLIAYDEGVNLWYTVAGFFFCKGNPRDNNHERA